MGIYSAAVSEIDSEINKQHSIFIVNGYMINKVIGLLVTKFQ